MLIIHLTDWQNQVIHFTSNNYGILHSHWEICRKKTLQQRDCKSCLSYEHLSSKKTWIQGVPKTALLL